MQKRKIGVLAIAIGAAASTAMIATPAEAGSANACATDYKIVSVSIKYKACEHFTSTAGRVSVDGLRLNDHGSPVSVSYQYALRDTTSGSVTYGGTWFTQTWAAGSGSISNSEKFGCVRGNTVRGLLHVKVNGVTGSWSESPSFTC